MDDTDYLDANQEASGDWPTNEEEDEILDDMQAAIDNDPKPASAPAYIVNA